MITSRNRKIWFFNNPLKAAGPAHSLGPHSPQSKNRFFHEPLVSRDRHRRPRAPATGTKTSRGIPVAAAPKRYPPPKPLHGVVHHIDTGSAVPVFARPRRLDPEKHSITEEEFLAMEKGIIRLSNSP